MSVHTAKPQHEIVYQELCQLVAKHTPDVAPIEILAVAANMVGKLIALQDQRVTTPDEAMQVVTHNLEIGNKQVIEQLKNVKGTPN